MADAPTEEITDDGFSVKDSFFELADDSVMRAQQHMDGAEVAGQRFFIPNEFGGEDEVDEETAISFLKTANEEHDRIIEDKARVAASKKIQAEVTEMQSSDVAVESSNMPKETIEFVLTGGKRTKEEPATNAVRSPQSDDIDMSFLDSLDLRNEEITKKQEVGITDFVANNVLPDEMSPEEFQAYQHFAATGEMPDGFPEKMLDVFKGIDSASAAAESISGRKSAKLARAVGDTIEWEDARNSGAARDEFYRSKRGWLESLGHELSIPQEVLARHAVVLLEKTKQISTEQAKDFLSQDALYPSDLANFYVDRINNNISGAQSFVERDSAGDATIVEKGGRLLVGLVSDIVLDPLTYLTGGLSAIAKTATVAGKTIKNMANLGKAERVWVRNAQAVEKIISIDGAVKNVGAAKEGVEALAKGKISIQDFNINSGASLKTRQQIQQAVIKNPEELSWGEKWSSGYHRLKVGYRIPFTKAVREVDLGLPASATAGAAFGFGAAGPVGAVVGAGIGAAVSAGALPRVFSAGLGVGKKVVSSVDGGTNMLSSLASFSSKTGKHIFDSALVRFYGDALLADKELSVIERRQREFFKQIEKQSASPEEFESILKAVNDEIEMAPLSWDQAIASGEQDITKFAGMITESSADIERRKLLSKYPGLNESIEEMRSLYKRGADMFKERGIRFEELSAPNGPLEARQYAKHMVTKEHLRWLKKQNESGEFIGGTMDYLSQGNKNLVARSERGRQYRGTINAANEAALEDIKKGHKVFVDDPIELSIKRNKEMLRIAKLHDAFKAAENYAIRRSGEVGGLWKNFKTDDFREFLLEAAEEIDDVGIIDKKIRSYLPDFYKTGDDIHLPYDVYDRLMYLAKGDVSLRDNPIMRMYSSFMQIFKRNALTGLAYQFTNIGGNAMNYMVANGVGGIEAGTKAAALMISPKAFDKVFGGLKVIGDDGIERLIKGDDLMNEALQNNVINSGASQELKFSQLADSVASNRSDEFGWGSPMQKVGQEIGKSKVLSTIGEAATFWRTNKWFAEKMDILPKLGTYIDRRQRGFSMEAASELADRYFYSYNMSGQNQNRLSQIVPFSKFAFKTLENTLDQVKNHELADIVMPDKVRRAMVGDYVEEPETREWLNRNLPQYQWVNSPTWGTVFPGQRQIVRQFPWAINTLNMFFNPNEDINPATKLLGSIFSTYITAKDEDLSGFTEEQFLKEVQRSAEMLIPAPILNTLQVLDLKDYRFGGIFAKNFEQNIPLEAEFEKAAQKPAAESPSVQMYLNSKEFGESFIDNELYKYIWGDTESGETNVSTKDKRIAARGEYIRRKFRQVLLGHGSLTKVDQNFFFRQSALKRQKNEIEGRIRSRMNDTRAAISDDDLLWQVKRGMVDPDSVAVRMPEIYDLMRIDNLMGANRDGYDFYLEHQFEMPNLDLGELLFGVSDKQLKSSDGQIDYNELTTTASDFDEVAAKDRAQQIWDKTKIDASSIDSQTEDVEPYEDEEFDDDFINSLEQ